MASDLHDTVLSLSHIGDVGVAVDIGVDVVLGVDAGLDGPSGADESARFGETILSVVSSSSGAQRESTDTQRDAPPRASFASYEVRIGVTLYGALDVPVILGRLPRAPRIVNGHRPRLVAVDSPAKVVSASHLSIRQVGSSLVITDLRTTNGSMVSVPGSPPRRLRQGESVVVTAGAQIDIGDGNVLYVLEARPVPALGDSTEGEV